MQGGRVYDPTVREAVQLLDQQGLTVREIAERLQISKSTVGRFSAPKAGKRKVLPKATRCGSCGALIKVVPCVTCQALAAPRPISKPDKERIDMGRVEKFEKLSVDLAEEEIERYRQIAETRPR